MSGQESIAAAGGLSRRTLLIGVVVGLVAFLLALLIPYIGGVNGPQNYLEQGNWGLAAFLAIAAVAVVVAIAAFVMMLIERTRSLAIGLFIALGAGLFIDAGTCIALANLA